MSELNAPSILIVDDLKELFSSYLKESSDIDIVSLNSSDGFVIHTLQRAKEHIDEGKIAALSSTISALSNSLAKEVLGQDFKVSIVETDESHILYIRTNYRDIDCVLTVVGSRSSVLGEARHSSLKVAEKVEAI